MALICSGRPSVGEELIGALAGVGVEASVARRREEWPDPGPPLVILDLGDPAVSVPEARLAFGREAYLVALVPGESAERLIPALAAGCRDYLFHPAAPGDIEVLYRRYQEETTRGWERSGAMSGRIQLEFPSDVRFLQDAVAQVVEACERLAFTGSRARLNLRVALGEAVANAILYGNQEDPNKRVRVSAKLESGRAHVVVTDEGTGFDPTAVEDPTSLQNRYRSRGRGLFLLRALADEVRYNEAGNAVTLILRS
ncbi:MAG: ATP-binding protein [Gemmatimonadota bacterium]